MTWDIDRTHPDSHVIRDYIGNWQRVANMDLYIHKTKELAITQTITGDWIVIEGKQVSDVIARYATRDETFDEWSHV